MIFECKNATFEARSFTTSPVSREPVDVPTPEARSAAGEATPELDGISSAGGETVCPPFTVATVLVVIDCVES